MDGHPASSLVFRALCGDASPPPLPFWDRGGCYLWSRRVVEKASKRVTVPQRFGILRLIGTLFKVAAWIVLAGSILLALAAGLAGPIARQFIGDAGVQVELLSLGSAGGLIVGVFLMIVGVILFLILYAAGENIFLQLAIEENTRMTAALMLRAAEENSPLAPASAPPPGQIYRAEVIE